MSTVRARITPPLKYHGGKSYLARKIIALMPPHVHYVEPYAGGLAVLLAKKPDGVSEVVNDIDSGLTNFWSVLRDPALFSEFQRVVQATPFCEHFWKEAGQPGGGPVDQAVKFFVRCRQSMAGRMRDFAPLSRTRTRRGRNEQASAWATAVDGLPAVHARLLRVAIYNHDALKVIPQQDGPRTLFYLDCPYLDTGRTSPEVYRFEMTEHQHKDLLVTVMACKGKVMLSGYASTLYDHTLVGWQRHEFRQPNHAAGGKTKRVMTEVVWCNF